MGSGDTKGFQSREGETDQWVKCLTHQHEDLSENPRALIKLDMGAHTYNPSAEKLETGGPLLLTS